MRLLDNGLGWLCDIVLTEHAPGETNDPDVRERLASFLSGDRFSCLGGKSALRRRVIVHRHYPLLGEAAGAAEHQRDLAAFVVYRPELDRRFATFIATFQGPGLVAEVTFERLLWRHLQAMHDVDSGAQGWAAERTSTPHERGFAFCVAGHPFFVVGLHPGALRLSRRFEFCAVAFNSHEQFDLLYREGTFRKLRAAIRERELALQGSINPNFVEYPDDEARHYAGRFTDPGWRCPFRPNV